MLMNYSPTHLSLLEKVLAGAVFAYPTEGVWGFGCLPMHEQAVNRLRALKSRDAEKGFILVASRWEQVAKFIENAMKMQEVWQHYNQGFVTGIFPASDTCPRNITAPDDSIAIRISTHPTVVALCDALDSALVSTSANYAGESPASDIVHIRQLFSEQIDCIVEGELGGADKPSRLLDLRHSPPNVLRP